MVLPGAILEIDQLISQINLVLSIKRRGGQANGCGAMTRNAALVEKGAAVIRERN